MNNNKIQLDNSKNNLFFNANEAFIKGNINKDSYDQYKNYLPVEPSVTNEQEATLLFIQKSDFATHDLNLYLDTHPDDQYAIDLRDFYLNEYLKAIDKYQKTYGPLLVSDLYMDTTPFAWIKGKWPWEGK